MPTKHTWTFKPRLRAKAFGWKGSHLARQRIREAVAEIKKVARVDPVIAGDGVVSLMERIWPAFQDIDTSSGALGGAVYWAQNELLPIAIAAPADRKTRDKWLERLWQAIEDDGVNYLSPVEDNWGELCRSTEVASYWADRLLDLLRTAWSDPRPGNYVRGTSVCLSSLLAAGRHRELLEVLALKQFPNWDDRKFGMQALLSQGRVDEALAYAEASRGLNQPDAANVDLPMPPEPFGTYAEAVQTGTLLFLSGMLPAAGRGAKCVGRLGAELDVEAGRKAAHLAARNALAVARQHLGSPDNVIRMVRLGVWVVTSEGVRHQPKVADAASEFLEDVFGTDKNPSRLVYGVASLPLGTPVEPELILEVAV